MICIALTPMKVHLKSFIDSKTAKLEFIYTQIDCKQQIQTKA